MTTPSIYCKKCGKPLTPGAIFCKYCGAPVPSAASQSASLSVSPSAGPAPVPAQPTSRNNRGFFLAGLGILAGACLCLALLVVVLFGVSCFNGTIVLEVGDTGQAHLTDSDLASGDAALFAEAGTAPDDNNYFAICWT